MSLGEQLAKLRDAAAGRHPPERLEMMHAATEKLRQGGLLARAAKVGDPLPPFALPNAAGETVRSAGLLAKGPIVLTVFRGVW